MAFPQNFLDELIARNDIVDVVSSYVHLTRKGSNLFGLCPFHNEKTGSFSVAPDKQIYHCFGCKKGGGVINFIMEIENLSFPDAVHFLAKRVNMQVPEDDRREHNQLRQRVLELNKDAARFFHQQLNSPQGAAVAEYLKKRQVSRATALNFGLGASLDQWDALTQAMTKKGYTKAELLAAGLVVQNKNGGFYDKFRNRLMFPVIDARGDVVGFGGRVLDKSEPKYMNTPETLVYSKRHTLYGLHLAKKTKRPNIILCEGNIDVIMLHQAGFDNAVASMGTALTTEQTRLLSRYTKELVLCYDNDGAGKIATQKALQILNNSEFQVKVLQLPRRLVDGEYVKQDPDDYIKFQGRDAFERLLNGSETGLDFRLEQICSKFDLKDDAQRIDFSKEVSRMLAELSSPVEREIYTTRAAQAAGLSPETLKLEVQQAFKRKLQQQKREQTKKDLNPAAASQPRSFAMRYENVRSALAEEGVIRLLTLDEGLFSGIFPEVEEFSSPLLQKVFTLLWEQYAQGHKPNPAALAQHLTGEEMDHLSSLLQKPEALARGRKALEDYLALIHHEYEKRSGSTVDPLLAASEKYKDKKAYGGKQ